MLLLAKAVATGGAVSSLALAEPVKRQEILLEKLGKKHKIVKISRTGRPTLDQFKRQDPTCAQFKPYRYLNWYISFISNKSRTVILIISDLTTLQKQNTRLHTDSYLMLFSDFVLITFHLTRNT